MSKEDAKTNDAEQRALLKLFHVIASRDKKGALALLKESPELAKLAISVGATREEAEKYFFNEISHYAYAGDAALHFAAATYQLEVAKKLITLGANVSSKNRRGATPLHYAADGAPGSDFWDPDAQFAVVEFLIKSGADPNSVDKSGVAPLHRAVRTRSTGAVRSLLANGADVHKKNKSGSTALQLAMQNSGKSGSGSAAALEEQKKIIKLLRNHISESR